MEFKYPEISIENSIKTKGKGWEQQCSTFEIMGKNIKYKNKKPPQQSPININTKIIQQCNTLCNLEINYKPTKCKIEKYEDNLIRLVHDEGSYIKYGENNYELKYVFFHTPSNHTIDGASSHMEINFYHGIMEDMDIERVEKARNIKIKNKHNHNHFHAHTDGMEDNSNMYGKKKGVVLSVLVNIDTKNETKGTKPNIFFSQFIHTDAFRDIKVGEDYTLIDVGEKWSMNLLFPKKRSFYTYNGSIAMPPCTEQYTWVIFEEQIYIIEEYLDLIRSIGNPKGNRNIHPLNNRVIHFNPNVKIEKIVEEENDKESYIDRKLSPIRITYDNRAGGEYKARASFVINKYSGGENTGWMTDGAKLKNIAVDWEETSKIGYKEKLVSDINEDDYEHIVFDYYTYNDFNYLEYYLTEVLKISKSDGKLKTIEDLKEEFTKEDRESISKANINGISFKNTDEYETNFNTISDNTKYKSIYDILNTYSSEAKQKVILYLLMSWDKSTFPDIIDLYSQIDTTKDNGKALKIILMKELIDQFKGPQNPNTQSLIFKVKTDELTTTLDGDVCQEWGSNKVHYEGNMLEFWKKPVSIPKEGMDFSAMSPEIKEAVKDGLMKYDSDSENDNIKFKRHNSCRNPNNEEGAPWCYTTNPKTRWQYCAIPDNTSKNKYYILFIVFIMIIVLAILLVKMIFKFEFFSKLVASITGGNIMSKSNFGDVSPPVPGGLPPSK